MVAHRKVWPHRKVLGSSDFVRQRRCVTVWDATAEGVG